MIAVSVLTLTFALAAIYNPVQQDDGLIRGELTRWLAAIPFALYGLYLFVQWQDTLEHEAAPHDLDVRPLWEWGKLVLSLGLIIAGVEGLLRAAIRFGEIFDTPSFLWGITVVAAATSVPDAFVSVRAARNGRALTSIANVLGSNTFDLLVCIPAGVLVAGTAVVGFSVAVPMLAALTAATIVLFTALRTGLVLTRAESRILLALYAAFVVWIAAETTNLVDVVPSIPPK
jgi:cation:H+ antiporter